MTKSTWLPASIILLFVMLWLPLGQHAFLIPHWMKVGTFAVPFLLMGIFAFYDEKQADSIWFDFRFIGVMMLIAYIAHQFEEHWIDLFGNEYAFYVFNNNFILSALGAEDQSIKPLTPESIFIINTSLVWLVAAVSILRSPQHNFPLIAFAGIILINGLVHILAAIVKWTYNPGLVTSIVIFTPLYFWFVRYLLKLSPTFKNQIIFGLIWALLAHIIMVGGLLAANWFQVFPEYVYFIILIIWSLVPLIFKG